MDGLMFYKEITKEHSSAQEGVMAGTFSIIDSE